MKRNTSTMVLTAGDFFPFRPPAAKAGPLPLENAQDTFLDYLLPVKKHLYNFVQKALNFSPDADDLFQEALLKGFRYFHSYDRGKSFKTWIFTIAHNLLKDLFRQKQLRHWPVSLEEAGEAAADGFYCPVPMSREVREIYGAAARLKPRQREVFFLYYYNEFSVLDIAAITGLTRANIKFILHQARSAVRKAMEVPE